MTKVNIFEELKATYAELDAHAENLAAKAKVSCTKGCSNCCYMLSLATGIEGANIAAYLVGNLDDKEFELMLKDLRAQALRAVFTGMTPQKYMQRQVKCAFLSEGNLCAIYPVRPAACRYHYVISPAVNCSPLALDTTTRTIDFRKLESVVWELDMSVNGAPLMAPVPLAVFWGCKVILKNSKHPRAAGLLAMVLKEAEGIIGPEEWMENYGLRVAESTAQGTGRPVPMHLAEK